MNMLIFVWLSPSWYYLASATNAGRSCILSHTVVEITLVASVALMVYIVCYGGNIKTLVRIKSSFHLHQIHKVVL